MKAEKDVWYIAYTKVCPPQSCGFLNKGNVLSTRYKDLECFDTKEEFVSRCKDLNIEIDEQSVVE